MIQCDEGLAYLYAEKERADMIKISTMTTTFRDHREDGMFTSYPESIRRCRAAGFEVLDLNMCSMSKAGTNELCGDDWERYVDDIITERDRQGIQFYQSHLPFRNASIVKFDDPLAEAFFWDMEHRALEITAKVGAKWAVVHPVYIPGEDDWQKQIEHNHRIYDGLVEHAAKLGVGIAFENMVEFDQSRHRFAAYSEEMIALCDDYHCETVGLCWDFGHANTAMPERHAEGLRSLGKRLKCVLTFTPLADEDRVLQKLVVPTLWMSVWLWESREFFCTRSSPVYPRVTQKTPNKHPVTYTEPGR